MRECLLCKRDMKVSKDLFGNGCIKNIYNFMNWSMPRKVNLREKTIFENVKKETKIRFLSENQKVWLTDRYLTYQYLNGVPYGNYDTYKTKIIQDIENMNNVDNESQLKSLNKISLRQAYNLYKKATKFQDGINKIVKGNFTDEESVKTIITSLSFIFNISKNKKQYENDAFKAMQYVFWQTVLKKVGVILITN